MKIRDAKDVIRNWPPVGTAAGRTEVLRGEEGVLVDAYAKKAESAIFVVIRRCAKKFIGVIFLSDCSIRTRILSLFQANLGRSLREIGDLEL